MFSENSSVKSFVTVLIVWGIPGNLKKLGRVKSLQVSVGMPSAWLVGLWPSSSSMFHHMFLPPCAQSKDQTTYGLKFTKL